MGMEMREPYVDAEMRPILDALRERMASRPSVAEISVQEMRARVDKEFAYWNKDGPELAQVEDRQVPGPFGPVTVRLYVPTADDELTPGLIYFHGGGWVIGNLDTEDRSLRYLAQQSGLKIISVDYCLAPEHKFPQPVEECTAVARYLAANGSAWGLDTDRMVLGGASAGANLALATAIALRDAEEHWVRHCLLWYGVYSADRDSESQRLFGSGDFSLGTDAMIYFWSCYLQNEAQLEDPRAAPLQADLTGLPPMFLVAAALDPLRDDTIRLANALTRAGVSAKCVVYPGVLHGFTIMLRDVAAARLAIDESAAALKQALVHGS